MCMKNVNINGFVCEKVVRENNVPSFWGVTDTLIGEKTDNGVKIDSFYIVVLSNILKQRDENELFTHYECSMRFTSFLGKTIEVARFALSDNEQIVSQEDGVVCKDFSTNRFFVNLKNFEFVDGAGRYILKILIRKKDEINNAIIEKDTQFMMQLLVGEKETHITEISN